MYRLQERPRPTKILPTPVGRCYAISAAIADREFRNTGMLSFSSILMDACRPILSITESGAAYVKAAVFKKSGVDIPTPSRQSWTRNCTKWETLYPDIPTIE